MAGQLRGVFLSPLGFLIGLGRAFDIGGNSQATRRQPVAILFAFHHEHRCPLGDRLAQFRQAIEHGGTGAGFVDPLAGFILVANAKVLGGIADFLADFSASGVAVAVGGHDFPLVRGWGRGEALQV